VSFIKWSAIRPLLPELKAFTGRSNARLRIISTTYTQATDYKAIITLANLPNTTVKINYETNHARMHAKSYLFKRDTGFSTAYIGSSNLSNPALTGGLEWNVKVTEKESFDIVKKFSVSFESYWNDDTFETFDPNDEACRKKLQDELSKPMFEKKNQRHLQLEFRPYAYQQEILDNLEAEREVHRHYNNLVVAATGVGKTLIAAFDYKRFKQRHLRPAFSWLRTEKRFWSRASECQEAYQITVEIMSSIMQVYSQDRYAQDWRDEGKNEIYQTGSI
jgi:HKD family nuclease